MSKQSVNKLKGKRAVIKTVTRGKHVGEFKFTLYAENGEAIAQSYPESYTQKHSLLETLQSNFPDFPVDDTTKPDEDVATAE